MIRLYRFIRPAGVLLCFTLATGCALNPFYRQKGERAMMKEAARPESARESRAGYADDTVALQPDEPAATNRRFVIYNATVRLESKDVEETKKEIIKIAADYKGYMQSSSSNRLTLKVPSKSLERFLELLKRAYKKLSYSLSADDVTEQYYDIETRLENAQKTRKRLLELLNKARSVEETLSVERELNRISQQIELWTGKLNRLKHQVALSTVTVDIYKEYTPPKEDSTYTPGPLGYPFYYLYKGLGYAGEGLLWLFVWEEESEE